MSPAGVNQYGNASVWIGYNFGESKLHDNSGRGSNKLRPVINLKADTMATVDSNGHYIVQN